MRKYTIAGLLSVGALLTMIALTTHSLADGETPVTPGSADDPIVTKSYIDKQVAQLVQAELAKQGIDKQELQNTLDAFKQEMQQSQTAQQVEVVSVPLGKKLIAKDGAEFVVRAGKAVSYSGDANGISDLTDGTDITNGKSVPNNHLILFPRGGRGVMAAAGQKVGLVVLVRGDYELQPQ
jgi:hypothetical protein